MARFSESRAKHIFRRADGHVLRDTAENCAHLLETVSDDYQLGTDRYGNIWYARLLDDGQQIWISVRNGVILNAGMNAEAHEFNPDTGLSREAPRGRT